MAEAVEEVALKRATSITAEERKYLGHALARKQQAEQMIMQAQKMISAFQEYGGYLAERYGIGPEDRINADGSIERAAAPVMKNGHETASVSVEA